MKRLAYLLVLWPLCVPVLAQQPAENSSKGEPANVWNRSNSDVNSKPVNNQSVDPTKNVLDLVEAAIRRQDDLRVAEARLQDALRVTEAKLNLASREADTRRLNELREAETRRINELQAQKQIFDLELARVIRAGLDASTLLLATQLKEVKTDASDRMAKLEQFANEQRGRASATDPAYTILLQEVRKLSESRADLAGRNTGQGDMIAYVFAVVGTAIGVGGLVLAFSKKHPPVIA